MKKYDVAAYIWPAYTGNEPRTRMFWSEGMGEWQSVKNSVSKYEGDSWPRKPLWGYVNEADPSVMEMEINAATRHGVNVFIYDWYWFDGRPFLEQCLDDGFLKAKNCNDMKFYLMWANHNANHVWNKELSDSDKNTVIWHGDIDFDEFKKIVKRVIEMYFHLGNYYTIDGCPVFMIYEINTFVYGMGGIENAKKALEYFRDEVKKAGFPGLHLQMTSRKKGQFNFSGVDSVCDFDNDEVLSALGIDSHSHYQFVHIENMNRDYLDVLADVEKEYEKFAKGSGTYFPHVSIGWDNNPRFKLFRDCVVKNNTPENFEKALRLAKAYVDSHPNQPPLVTINSWNEWTETSYLEPDDLYGYGYLEAVKRVFTE